MKHFEYRVDPPKNSMVPYTNPPQPVAHLEIKAPYQAPVPMPQYPRVRQPVPRDFELPFGSGIPIMLLTAIAFMSAAYMAASSQNAILFSIMLTGIFWGPFAVLLLLCIVSIVISGTVMVRIHRREMRETGWEEYHEKMSEYHRNKGTEYIPEPYVRW